ncbi:hypothetical protein M422DRAFT_256015 [Sphaerobolus stellatus SS14]|uniref:CCHC-type domain-containing protein n=1 Tax=Sphaerobolus stellatus (strain SS14) TaxID=990650 RepID=A0A0C9V1C9_SPHS4|nr:hypothetical protein M422DRAFT_256015 [Sphaerobolus stellatus SS14]
MAPKKKIVDKVPAGTGDAADSGSTPNVIGGNDPTMDPGKDPSKTASAVSEANTIHPTTQTTHATDELAHLASEQGMSEDPTQTPNPHGGSGDPLLPKTYSDYSEPSEQSASTDPDPQELALGNQIQEMLDTINEHMDEVKSIHNMSCQAAQLLVKINESNSALEARTRTLSNPKQALGRAQTELLAKTAVLEQLYADQAPADHLNQAATAAQSTHMEYKIDINRSNLVRMLGKPRYEITPVKVNHQEGSVPFQQLDDRDILDMSNSESDNALVRMVKYMLDQNIHTTMEISPLAKAGVKVTPPDKYSEEQSFEALETFVSFLGTRLEGKALKWFDKTVKPRKYQGTPMDLEQVVTGLYGQYIPSLVRCKASNKFDFIKQGMLSVQEFASKLKLRRPRNNGPDRTKSRADPPKSGEINKGSLVTPGPSGVNRNSSTAPGETGPPIINRQRTNHDSSHNSIECYNCGKSGHIKPNCPEPIRAHCVGAVHIEDSPMEQVDNTDHDINDPIDDECPTEDGYCNEDYDNQLDLSEDQCSWGSKPSEFDYHDMARVAAAVPIGPANARKAKLAKEGEPLYDHMVKMKTTRPTRSKNDLLTIAGYFLVGGTKACCLFNSGCEGIIMSSEFAQATGIHMHKLLEPIGIQQAFQGGRVKLYYTATTDITVGQRTYTEMFDITNVNYYDIMLGTLFLRRVKANIDFNGLGSINLSVRNYPSRQPPSGSDSERDSPSTHSSTPVAGEWKVWLETVVVWWRVYAHVVIAHE